MNNELWEKILEFDLETAEGDYSFSDRLAAENFWSKKYTRAAIIEYKKFMYLAAVSDQMVSPSEIVDTVWHLHLIFTISYQKFCDLLGKQIQHIPSTHSKEDHSRFQKAKERTTKLYEETFGPRPYDIWEWRDMYEGLNLSRARLKTGHIILFGLLLFAASLAPVYLVLKPFYVKIASQVFLLWYLALIVFVSIILEVYNRIYLKKIAAGFDRNSFVFELEPFELIYLKTSQITRVINGTMNELIKLGAIRVRLNNKVEVVELKTSVGNEQRAILAEMAGAGEVFYPDLVTRLVQKPAFQNVVKSMGALRKYFTRSQKFNVVFIINFSAHLILLMGLSVRIITGVLRDKPVIFISSLVAILIFWIAVSLNRLGSLIWMKVLPTVYRKEILPILSGRDDWRWKYFLVGGAALTFTFSALAKMVTNRDDLDGGMSSYGRHCGSSCSTGDGGGGCGGCGGD